MKKENLLPAEKLVGISPVSMSAAKAGLLGELYPEILDADTSFFENNELNIESLLTLEPDLVFYNAQNKELGESLASAGLTAVAVSVTKWDYNASDTFDRSEKRGGKRKSRSCQGIW